MFSSTTFLIIKLPPTFVYVIYTQLHMYVSLSTLVCVCIRIMQHVLYNLLSIASLICTKECVVQFFWI